MARTHGRCPRLVMDVPHGHGKTTTFVPARRSDGMTAPVVIDGAVTGDVFVAYVEQPLVPALRPGDRVVMDNLACHKRAGVRVAVAAGVPPGPQPDRKGVRQAEGPTPGGDQADRAGRRGLPGRVIDDVRGRGVPQLLRLSRLFNRYTDSGTALKPSAAERPRSWARPHSATYELPEPRCAAVSSAAPHMFACGHRESARPGGRTNRMQCLRLDLENQIADRLPAFLDLGRYPGTVLGRHPASVSTRGGTPWAPTPRPRSSASTFPRTHSTPASSRTARSRRPRTPTIRRGTPPSPPGPAATPGRRPALLHGSVRAVLRCPRRSPRGRRPGRQRRQPDPRQVRRLGLAPGQQDRPRRRRVDRPVRRPREATNACNPRRRPCGNCRRWCGGSTTSSRWPPGRRVGSPRSR
ncbi:IS630 family transposase [Limnoglobus roseus]|uniref:IS630 family transposase n=1 Tax=Limnoglobus roseus TaxID=2598579 RepID=A0A5C1AE02_9BACT|nr:IS630 family transposase [Limnoglobus roseus]